MAMKRSYVYFCRSWVVLRLLTNHYNKDPTVWLDGTILPTPVSHPPSKGMHHTAMRHTHHLSLYKLLMSCAALVHELCLPTSWANIMSKQSSLLFWNLFYTFLVFLHIFGIFTYFWYFYIFLVFLHSGLLRQS